MNKLETTQRWLTSIIVRPGALSDKIPAAGKVYALDAGKMIRTSGTMSPESRIGVYARGYVLRLMECMRADYPLLLQFLGEELFNTFARAYLVRLPSHSPSLYDLGAHFPAFLKASQPAAQTAQSMFDLPVELALAERMRVEVERSTGLEGMQEELFDDPLLYFSGGLKLQAAPCLRLLELSFELEGFMRSPGKPGNTAIPERRKNYMAICRKDYRVSMQSVEAWQYYYLLELQQSDHTAAIKKAASESGFAEEEIMAELLLWLPVAAGYGYVKNMTPHPGS